MKNIKKTTAITLILIVLSYIVFNQMIATMILIVSFAIITIKFLIILSKKESINQFTE